MIIENNGTTYTISEHNNKWKVSKEDGILSITYDVPKELCRDKDDLTNYIFDNATFWRRM